MPSLLTVNVVRLLFSAGLFRSCVSAAALILRESTSSNVTLRFRRCEAGDFMAGLRVDLGPGDCIKADVGVTDFETLVPIICQGINHRPVARLPPQKASQITNRMMLDGSSR